MDPAVIASIIGAVATVGTGATTYVAQQKKIKRIETTHGSIHDQLIGVYGFKARRHRTHAKILDASGRVHLRREWNDIEVVQVNQRLRSLSHQIEVSGRPDGDPKLEVLEGSAHITETHRPWIGGRSVTELSFKPDGLQRGKRISYALTVETPETLLVSAAAIAAAYKGQSFELEYFAGRVQIPTDELVVEVEFPDGHLCDCSSVVFLPKTEISHERLQEQIDGGLTRHKKGATLTIKAPLIEFGYAICWRGN